MSDKPVFDKDGYQKILNKKFFMLEAQFVWEQIKKYIEHQTENDLWEVNISREDEVNKLIFNQYILGTIEKHRFDRIIKEIDDVAPPYGSMLKEVSDIIKALKSGSDAKAFKNKLPEWLEDISLILEIEINTSEMMSFNILFREARIAFWGMVIIGFLSLLANIVQLYINHQ